MITPARWVLPSLLVLLAPASAGAEEAASRGAVSPAPRVFLLDARHLEAARERIRGGDPSLAPALAQLERDAEKAIAAGPFSVVHKEGVPPSGDKRDYMSQAPYYWPNPATADGLPYVRRDGERNPEINRYADHRAMDDMVAAVETLALAHYFQGHDAYGARAAQLLRAWFLDPATRMHPHLRYAQAVPGVNSGRGYGLIETRGLPRVVDAIGLLAGAKAWTEADERDLREWFEAFLQWMLESENGREESTARNNHGTYYDVQVASFALFVGRRELATTVLAAAGSKRIARQIEPDGRQPRELERTKAWSYSTGNLKGLMSLADLGEVVGVDLWHYQTADGRGIRRALDYLLPFAAGEARWPHRQLGSFEPRALSPALRAAAVKYPGDRYRAALRRMPALDPADRIHLLRPGPEATQGAREGAKLRTLIVTGGHGFEKEPFFQMFRDNADITFTAASQDRAGATAYDRDDLLDHDVLVLYDMPRTISDAQKAKFLSLFDRGVGLVVLHHALVSYQDWPEYERLIGGRYPEEEGKSGVVTLEVGYEHDVDIPVAIAAADHPITAGLKDFTIHDEIYWGFRVRPDVTPILTTSHPKSGKPLGWTRTEGKSRVVYLQPGHGPTAFNDPNYRKLVAQSIRWAGNRS